MGMTLKIYIFFFEKRIQNGQLKKTEIFKTANSQYLFSKILWIGPDFSTPWFQKSCYLGKSGFEKFIAEKSGVERSGVEMSFNQKKKNFRHPYNFMGSVS